nr:small multi-drug export protein [Maliibacterium massiliense]
MDLAGFFSRFWLELTVFGSAMVPLTELKGAIILGQSLGLGAWEAFTWAFLGSSLPVPFILLFMKPIMRWMRKTRLFGRFADWLERRSEKKGGTIRKYEYLGLFIFVAIPLPTTGVWTGSLIASLLDLRISRALPVILIGNAIAGLAIMFLYGIVVL